MAGNFKVEVGMVGSTCNFDEACAYLKASSTSLSDLVAIGELPAAKISKNWVFRQQDLDNYLAEQVRVQTERRREAFRSGSVVRIATAVGQVRNRRKSLPALPVVVSQTCGRRKAPPVLPEVA